MTELRAQGVAVDTDYAGRSREGPADLRRRSARARSRSAEPTAGRSGAAASRTEAARRSRSCCEQLARHDVRRAPRGRRRQARHASPAGRTRAATTAASSSSTCATTRARCSSSSTRSARPRLRRSRTRSGTSSSCRPKAKSSRRAPGRREPEHPDRRDRDPGRHAAHRLALGAAAVPDRRRERRRGAAAPLPLSRHARRAHAAQPAPQPHGDQRDPPRDGRARLRRRVDAVDDEGNARGCARLPRARAAAARDVLRARAVAAALQAALHGRRARPLLPDRDVLARRGSPRRPAVRVPPARPRDVVRRPRGRARRDGARRRRGVRGRRARAAGAAVPAPHATPRRWRSTAPTSRTSASASRSTTRPRSRATRSSASSPSAPVVRYLVAPRAFSRAELARLEEIAKEWGAKGLAYLVHDESGEIRSPIAKFLSEDELAAFARASPERRCSSRPATSRSSRASSAACARTSAASSASPRPGTEVFHWVIDFPLFERDEDTGQLDVPPPSVHRARARRRGQGRVRSGRRARASTTT